MKRHNLIIGLLVASVVLTLPAASADEDPTFSVPDPAPVTSEGADTAQFTAGDALTTYAAVEQNLLDAVDSATSGDPSIPVENLDNIAQEVFGLADRSALRASGYQSTAQTWTFQEVQGKVQEVNYTATRTIGSGMEHSSSAGQLARLVLASVCRDSVMGDGCDEGSLVGELSGNSDSTTDEVTGTIDGQQQNVDAFTSHVQMELDLLLCGGPCD